MERGSGSIPAVRYLDSDLERRALIKDIIAVRQQVIDIAQETPQDQWYEPRYHGWSLAAMLSHLHNVDNLAMLQIKLALMGIPFRMSSKMLDRINDAAARLLRRRLITTTINDIRKNETRIGDFIMYLPMDRFSKDVFYPPTGEIMTVERALQQYFLFHWHLHLATLQRDEGIYYEPPAPDIDMV